MTLRILVRGGGDLASGVILRLFRAGWQVLVTELAEPMAVRRYVSFAQAIYDGEIQIEDGLAQRVDGIDSARESFAAGMIPIMIDPDLRIKADFSPDILIDGRMRKQPNQDGLNVAPFVIGLGPGFTAGIDCHAVVETMRGPFLGRVIWQGQAQPDTGVPERVGDYQNERVLRAPKDGPLQPVRDIGSVLQVGEVIARVDDEPILAPFNGVLRGLVQGGLHVRSGDKVGDVDPRGDTRLCWLVSEKALAVGGGVLEAILTWQHQQSAENRKE